MVHLIFLAPLHDSQIKTATGPDGVRGSMRNIGLALMAKALQVVYQAIHAPRSCCLHSNVIPISKQCDSSNASHYCPISLFPLISKTLERIVHNHMMQFLLSNNLLPKIQFGFRPCSSTQEALLTVVNNWHNQLTSHHQVEAVFFDT